MEPKTIEINLEKKNAEHAWSAILDDGTEITEADTMPKPDVRDRIRVIALVVNGRDHALYLKKNKRLIFFRKNQFDFAYPGGRIPGSDKHQYILGMRDNPGRLVRFCRWLMRAPKYHKSVIQIMPDGSIGISTEDGRERLGK